METTTTRNSFLQRLIGAAALDTAIYEEVEADRAATTQAFLVVLLSSLAAGIGARGLGILSPVDLVLAAGLAVVSWAAWALLTYEIGARLLPQPGSHVDVGELLRTLGFSTTPGLLLGLAVMPAVALPVFVITSVWLLVAMVVAVRHALDYTSTLRAIGVCLVGWFLIAVVAGVIGLIFAPSVG